MGSSTPRIRLGRSNAPRRDIACRRLPIAAVTGEADGAAFFLGLALTEWAVACADHRQSSGATCSPQGGRPTSSLQIAVRLREVMRASTSVMSPAHAAFRALF